MDENFKELSAEQVSEMESADQLKYFNELNAHRERRISALEEKAKNDQSDALKAEIETLKAETTEILDKHGVDLKKLKQNHNAKRKSFKDIIAEKSKDIYNQLASGKSGSYSLEVDKTTVAMSAITDDPAGVMLPGVSPIQTQRNTIANSLNTFQMGADSHGIVRYTDWTTATSGADSRSDGSAAGESVAEWTGYNESLKNISDSIPVQLEALRDVAMMESELKNFLNNNLQVKEDSLLYSGTGISPSIKGLYTYATAFDAAAYVAAGGYTPSESNLYDLVIAMAAQIMKASKYTVDTVYLNPYDAIRLKLEKDKNGQYLFPAFMVTTLGGPMVLDNIKVVQSNSVTVNTCVVADSTYLRRYVGENIEITMGYNTSGDFTKRIITILANMAELLLVRTAEQDCMLKSTDLTSDIAGIEASVA